jgi:hypothetical protein
MKREVFTSEWKANPGSVPRSVRLGVMVQVEHKDGTMCTSDDFDHRDLWIPEKGAGYKDIVRYRLV